MQKFHISERLACRVLGQHRSTQRKVPRGRPDEAALTADIIALASQYGRYGYRRITSMLREAGWAVNVKRVELIQQADQYITYTVLPELKRLGPRLGKRLPALRKRLSEIDPGKLLAQMEAEGQVTLELPDGPVELDRDDLRVRLEAKAGWAAAQGRLCVVVLSTELTEELISEGLGREAAHAINVRRREIGCEYTDRIVVGIVTESAELQGAIEQYADYIKAETLTVELTFAPVPGAEPAEVKLSGHSLTLYVKVIS